MSEVLLDAMRPRPTGGLIVTFKPDCDAAMQQSVLSAAAGSGVRAASAGEASEAYGDAATPAVMIEDIGVAVVTEREDVSSVRSLLSDNDAIEEVRPEFWMFAIDAFSDLTERTWGLAATGAFDTDATGAGTKICVLDTGLDLGHPDFAQRTVAAYSFVHGETADDVQGHGTHCAGTAAGPAVPQGVPRYGVAPEAELLIGKVLNNSGSGRERDILAGMAWGIGEAATVISMSLGRATQVGETFSVAYERLGRRALDRGTLIVAAAGNESARRFGFIAPVGAPANSPSIMAVAAVDQDLGVADFSCGGINGAGGEVDIAAPGVGVFSSVPRPQNYRTLQGTSMACPHVAGLAALWASRDPGLRGQALWDMVLASAEALNLPARDVGAGLAKAPPPGAPPLA